MKTKLLILLLALCVAKPLCAFTTTESETLKVWFDDFTIVPDGKTVAYLHVYENDNLDYTAFNMTFTLPKGLKVNMVKQGRDMVEDIFLSERASSTHSISCNLLEDGTTLKVIADSSRNDDLYPDDEDGNQLDLLYTVGLIADPDMSYGEYTVEMTGIKFVLSDGDASVPVNDHVFGTVTVASATTGIDEIQIDDIDEKCYDILGRPVTDPVPGTIIIYRGKKRLIR